MNILEKLDNMIKLPEKVERDFAPNRILEHNMGGKAKFIKTINEERILLIREDGTKIEGYKKEWTPITKLFVLEFEELNEQGDTVGDASVGPDKPLEIVNKKKKKKGEEEDKAQEQNNESWSVKAVERLLDCIEDIESDRFFEDFLEEAGMNVKFKGRKGKNILKVDINGHEYGYDISGQKDEPAEIERKFKKMIGFSPGRALAWIKKNSKLAYGSQKKMKEEDKKFFESMQELRDILDEEKPGAHLSKEKRSEIVKKAKKGKDIGKPGKKFKEVEVAAKKGGAKDPAAVAAAAMWKSIK